MVVKPSVSSKLSLRTIEIHSKGRNMNDDVEFLDDEPDRGQSSNAWVWIVGIIAAVSVIGVLMIAILVALLLPAVSQARTAAQMTQSKNNMKQIGLALHNYHDVYSTFPPGGIYDGTTPHRSWSYSILPFVYQAPLFNNIDHHTPWNSPRNTPLHQVTIPEFLNPGNDFDGLQNGFAVSHYAGNSHVFFENSSIKIRNFSDGTSNTILVGEVSDGFKAWGDPTNVRDPGDGIAGGPNHFGGPFPKGTQFLMGDGSVRTFGKETDIKILKALSTPNGGEEIDEF